MPFQDLQHLEDELLFELIRKDNRAAFSELYNRYWNKLYLYLIKVIRHPEETEDILQEVFVSIWNRRQELNNIESIKAYLFSSARFKGLNFLHREVTKGKVIDHLLLDSNKQDTSLENQQSAKEIERVLENTIEDLPSKMQQVFVLSRKEQLSYKEIADTLNISDKTVKKQINNALKIFKMKLQKEKLISLLILLSLIGE